MGYCITVFRMGILANVKKNTQVSTTLSRHDSVSWSKNPCQCKFMAGRTWVTYQAFEYEATHCCTGPGYLPQHFHYKYNHYNSHDHHNPRSHHLLVALRPAALLPVSRHLLHSDACYKSRSPF